MEELTVMNNSNTPEEIHVRHTNRRLNSASVSIVAILFFAVSCIWLLFYLFSFSKAEQTASILERDFFTEYKNSTDTVKSLALDGIYTIDLTYIIPDTQIAAPMPNPDNFGKAAGRDELVPVVQQAEEYGLLDGDDLVFSREDTPWTEEVKAEYYLDQTIFSVSWKALVSGEVVNFTEVVIAHPSQFRKYLTENTFASGKRKTVSTMSGELNAVIGMSADFYAYRHAGVVVQGGKLYRNNMSTMDHCFINRSGELILAPRRSIRADELEQYIADNDISFSLSFGPILVENGEISDYCYGKYIVGQPTDAYSRSAIGQLGDLHYLLCTIDGGTTSMGKYRKGTTVVALAKLMHEMDCINAYTLDGGQTATLTVNGSIFNRVGYGNERPVSDIIYFATALPDGN